MPNVLNICDQYSGVYFVWLSDLGPPWKHVNFFGRSLSQPPQARDWPSLPWSATVAASAIQALVSAVETGQVPSVETRKMPILSVRRCIVTLFYMWSASAEDICLSTAPSLLSEQQKSLLLQEKTSVFSLPCCKNTHLSCLDIHC